MRRSPRAARGGKTPRMPHLPWRFSRREALAFTGAALLIPACAPGTKAKFTFLTETEGALLDALADTIWPPDADGTGGGAWLGTTNYVDRLLSIFEPIPSSPWLGGPNSGRQPLPADDGTPSTKFPPNDFANLADMGRVAEHAWRVILYGSDGVMGGAPNDAVIGPVVGLRTQVRDGLAQAKNALPANFATLPLNDRTREFLKVPDEVKDLLVDLTSQACFGAPQYGGNKNGRAWEQTHFDGDSQPLGYSLWDKTTQKYKERPDKPNSTANPGADPDPLDDETKRVIGLAVMGLGGRVIP